jgi:hypothetical protein
MNTPEQKHVEVIQPEQQSVLTIVGFHRTNAVYTAAGALRSTPATLNDICCSALAADNQWSSGGACYARLGQVENAKRLR